MTTESVIRMTFADSEETHVTCGESTTIFDAARSAGVALAHDCLNGTCGTCRGTLTAGTVAYALEADQLALPKGESAGQPEAMLPCQAKPTSASVDLTLPYSRASLLPEKKRKLKVLSKTRVSETVWDVRCKAEGLRMFDFLPGQYVRVTPSGQNFTRAYSPYTVPGTAEIGFLIRELENGAMSHYLRDHPVENDVWAVSGPYGVFYRRHTHAPSLYVAGGTGLAPVLSMLGAQQKLGLSTGPKKVVFGVTRASDLFYVKELQALAEAMPEVSVVVTVMEGATEPSIRQASVVDVLSEADFAELGQHGAAYLCGPPGMVNAVRERAAGWAVAQSRIFSEEFLPS